MEYKDVFQLYEKLYFHEIDAREKLSSRLQAPLALIVSLIGTLAFFLQNYNHQDTSYASYLFVVLIFLSAIGLTRAIYTFVRSWYDNIYFFLPSSEDTERYREQLIEIYKEYEHGEKLAMGHFSNYLMKYYIECSSKNTICNDRRSIFLHKTSTALIFTALFMFAAFLPFYFGGLNKNEIRKVTEVSIVNPISLTGGNMSDLPKADQAYKTPPPPPPPPPLRQIREGIEVVPPKPSLSNQKGKSDGK
ncbi:MAG: hypothetical protein HQL74_09495 [Magnetococcales bacterium]|nr:hypothetical protein [Magnetococcales bacterium]